MQLDLADLKSIKQGAEAFLQQYDRLDVLIANAGTMAPPPSMKTADGCASELTPPGLIGADDMQFGTNVLGHHYLLTCVLHDRLTDIIRLVLPLMLKTAKSSPPGSVRFVSLSSSGHALAPAVGIDFDNINLNGFNRWAKCARSALHSEADDPRYGQSKLGNVLLAKELDRRHRADGIVAVSVHPGVIGAQPLRSLSLTIEQLN